MRTIKLIIKSIFLLLLILDITLFVAIYVLGEGIAESYKVNKGDTLRIDSNLPVTAVVDGARMEKSDFNVGDTFKVDLKMFGIIPFSKVDVEVVDEMYAAVLGTPFGMKLYTDGVLVIDMTDVNSPGGKKNPALDAGIKIGDYIKSANGCPVTCNEDLAEIVEASMGEKIRLETVRNGKTVYRNVSPICAEDNGGWKIGVWVRDSSAGIGTLTFYSPSTGIVCGLGHGICDNDTGSLLKLNSGELVGAQIISVVKGSSNDPGELKGRFTSEKICNINLNCEKGVYGELTGSVDASNLTEIALKQNVKNGKAQILCTIDGNKPQLFECEIEKRQSAFNSPTQNIVITVTDKRLINATGGIVQGLSGSPILQDDKLVGAVTHVLVDDPTKGYGIFAENMLETAQNVAQKQLKEAS